MVSKAKIEKKLQKKTNSNLVETIIAAKKQDSWKDVANILSGPRRNQINVNLEELNKIENEKTIIVPGKVLSGGEINKKIKISALSFSEKAKEKLLNTKCEVSNILQEIKKNPEAKGIKILDKKEK